jgi:hypothetical protein
MVIVSFMHVHKNEFSISENQINKNSLNVLLQPMYPWESGCNSQLTC